MLKKKMLIILTALMICSFTACSTQDAQTIANTTKTAVTAQNTQDTESTASAADADTTPTNASESATVSEKSESKKSATQPTESTSTKSKKNNTTTAESSQNTNTDNVNSSSANNNTSSDNTQQESRSEIAYTANTSGKLDTTDIFSNRDLSQTADTSNAVTITAQNNKTETITKDGVYILTGTASNFTVKIETDKESKVQLVLDGLNVTNSNFPVIYVVSADKCFVTTTNSTNTLSVTGTFTADGDTNTDAVIYSKDDLVFNGMGTLNITSTTGNGISGKDDVKFTGGTYNIQSAKDSIEAHDSIVVYDGTFNITSSKDGLHSENSDDDSVGYIYIQNGNFTIKASSDAIQATTVFQIDGGSFNLNASEGIEATYIQINDGTIDIYATDDGINGAMKSKSFGTPTIEFNGGYIKVAVGQGDTDAIDCNGNIIVNGGTIDITAQMSSFDYDGTAQYNGGTIIINGSQVNYIPQSMMGGIGGMKGNFGRM